MLVGSILKLNKTIRWWYAGEPQWFIGTKKSQSHDSGWLSFYCFGVRKDYDSIEIIRWTDRRSGREQAIQSWDHIVGFHEHRFYELQIPFFTQLSSDTWSGFLFLYLCSYRAKRTRIGFPRIRAGCCRKLTLTGKVNQADCLQTDIHQ